METKVNNLTKETLKQFKLLLAEAETAEDYADIINAIDDLSEKLEKLRDKAVKLSELAEG